jgi:hypothetical protein
MTSTSSFSFKFSGSAGPKVLGIEYVYNGPKNRFLHLAATVNGAAVEGNALVETSRSTTFAQEVPFPVKLESGDDVEFRLLDWDGNAFLVDGVKVYEDLR